MDVERIAAFAMDGAGGNPAGVVIGPMPSAAEMQRIAAQVGYSETVFAQRQGDGFRARYFAPGAEVPFCGHATIALGAALGAQFGAGVYPLTLNEALISVEALEGANGWEAELQSPATSHRAVEADDLAEVLALFGWDQARLDPEIAPVYANGGAEHLVIALARPEDLAAMAYDFDAGAALMQRLGLVTINVIWRERADRIHARNAFAGHGVLEDPATGAAAAALAGYLRDAGLQATPFEIIQGVDMGVPSRLRVRPGAEIGGSVAIAGATRRL